MNISKCCICTRFQQNRRRSEISRYERLSYIHIPIDRPDRQTYISRIFLSSFEFPKSKTFEKKTKIENFHQTNIFLFEKAKNKNSSTIQQHCTSSVNLMWCVRWCQSLQLYINFLCPIKFSHYSFTLFSIYEV